jgi:hypothetical protein
VLDEVVLIDRDVAAVAAKESLAVLNRISRASEAFPSEVARDDAVHRGLTAVERLC